MPSPVTLIISSPKELIRAGLRTMLAKSSVKIIGDAVNAASTFALVRKHCPKVLLVDAAMPAADDPFALLKKVRKSVPATNFILLSAEDNPTYMARARAAGASDFLLQSVTTKELTTAIENAAAGTSTKGTGAYARITVSMDDRSHSPSKAAKLTPRESQVLSHVAYGLSNDEIARSLKISVETVKEHVQNMLRKLALRDRTQAAVWAVRGGLA